MNNDSNISSAKNPFSFKAILILTGVVIIFMFCFTSYCTLLTEGSGRARQWVNRSAHTKDSNGKRLPQGLFVLLDPEGEIQIPPTGLWSVAQEGDVIKKQKGSYCYYINGSVYNTLSGIIRDSFQVGVVAFLFWTVIFWLTRRI